MDTLLYTLCALGGWVGFGYVLRLLRRQPDTARVAMCVSIGSFAAGITIAVPPVSAAIDSATHLPNLAKVTAHAGAMSVAAAAEIMLLYLTHPPAVARHRMGRWLWQSVSAYALMIALWALTLTYHPPVRLTVDYARVPAVTAYLLVFVAFGFLTYSVDIARLCWRFAAVCGRPWLRRGMRITAVGAVFALLYCVSKISYLGGYLVGAHPADEADVAAVLVTFAAVFMLVGLTIPAWGPVLSTGHWRRRRAYRRLYPLWHDISAVHPHLVLKGGLHRRVVEIYDGRMALRPYLHRPVGEAAGRLACDAGLSGEDARAVVEAATIAGGIRRAGRGAPAPDPAIPDWYAPAGGYDGEVRWLVRVADAYLRSPLVARALAESADPRPAPAESTVEGTAR